MKLSAARATTVVEAIVAGGIDKARLEAEGYGDQHPVADNGTEAGRAQNRRIAVRVTKK
jgi:flagellar motor protein MotB